MVALKVGTFSYLSVSYKTCCSWYSVCSHMQAVSMATAVGVRHTHNNTQEKTGKSHRKNTMPFGSCMQRSLRWGLKFCNRSAAIGLAWWLKVIVTFDDRGVTEAVNGCGVGLLFPSNLP